MAAIGATSAFAGEKARNKMKFKRKEPPARQLANVLLGTEAARRMSGKLSFTDKLEQNRLRSESLRGIANLDRSAMRTYGEMGVEGPGMLDKLTSSREAGIASLIGAANAEQIARREGGVPILQNLLAENRPYVKGKEIRGPMWAKVLAGGVAGIASMLGMGEAEKAGRKAGQTGPSAPSGANLGVGGGGGYSLGNKGLGGQSMGPVTRNTTSPRLQGNSGLMTRMRMRYSGMGGRGGMRMAGGMR